MPVTKNQALDYHFGERHGKMEVTPSKPSRTQPDLNLAYTPGIADPAWRSKKVSTTLSSTPRGNLVAVVSNGTTLWGLAPLPATQ